MILDATPPCANGERLQARLDALQVRFDALWETVAQLRKQLAAARKDSSNSPKMATCGQQGRSVFAYLEAAVTA